MEGEPESQHFLNRTDEGTFSSWLAWLCSEHPRTIPLSVDQQQLDLQSPSAPSLARVRLLEFIRERTQDVQQGAPPAHAQLSQAPRTGQPALQPQVSCAQ